MARGVTKLVCIAYRRQHEQMNRGSIAMEFTFNRNAKIVAILLLIAAATQAVYTGLYVAKMDVPRQLLWGGEGILFTIMAAFAGAAMVQSKTNQLGWAAIAAASILNVVQVGVGLTLFGPFSEVAKAVPDAAPLAGGIVAYSFMVYNAAKMLLALALIVLGLSRLGAGSKLLGGASALVGVLAFIANALSMTMGREFAGELPLAGGLGVLATVLLAVCLLTLGDEASD